MTMLETLVSGLLGTGVTAVVFVAYRHPEAFAKLYASIKPVIGWAAIAVLAWALAENSVRDQVHHLLPPVPKEGNDPFASIRALITTEPRTILYFLGLGGLWLALEALAALPRHGIVAPNSPQEPAGSEPPASSPSSESNRAA